MHSERVADMNDESKKGDYAVVARVPQEGGTFKAFFLDGIDRVDEKTARIAFGLAIRAGELGIPVEGEKIDAVRLLKWDPNGSAFSGDWKAIQEHETNKCEKWRNDVAQGGDPRPYREDSFHPGVPCMGGAWGSATSCAMHWGLPLDSDNICVEGRRGAKYLGLVVVPRAIQERHGFHSTMTRAEIDLVIASARAELVSRGNDEHITDAQLQETVEIFDRELARIAKQKTPARY